MDFKLGWQQKELQMTGKKFFKKKCQKLQIILNIQVNHYQKIGPRSTISEMGFGQ